MERRCGESYEMKIKTLTTLTKYCITFSEMAFFQLIINVKMNLLKTKLEKLSFFDEYAEILLMV
ncbi:hypothetical protein T4C_6746 [Trichinella pseudospiralis]|uniref:Uncharacterized protein n=1 Tax=Trichinella pseudospiralis TaxID=6337 RepID=A0A0V1J384_TRIPS|nr:hypothetical protein T4C_6746 [Trichinella pseudospiralis]